MKNLLLTTALVAGVATSAMADGSHFNAGVYGGFVSGSTEVKSVDQNGVSMNSADLGGTGGQGGLLLGYNYVMDSGLVLGADVFGQFGGNKAEVKHNDRGARTLEAKQKYGFGVAARFGYMFDTTHAYLRVGFISSRFELSHKNANRVVADRTVKKNLNGLLIGFGADMPVGEMMTVGFGYDYSMFKKRNVISQTALATTADNTVTAPEFNSEFKPRTHAFNVVLKYKF